MPSVLSLSLLVRPLLLRKGIVQSNSVAKRLNGGLQMISKEGLIRIGGALLAALALSMPYESSASRGELFHKALTESYSDIDRASDSQRVAQRSARKQRLAESRDSDDSGAPVVEYGGGAVMGLTRYTPEPVLVPEPAE